MLSVKFVFIYLIFLKVDPKPAVPQGPGMQSKPLVSKISKWFLLLTINQRII